MPGIPLPQVVQDRREHTLAQRCGPVRKSTRSRWRALVLTLVYVVFAAHYVHWRLAGQTLTPVEPSEAMQTLETGLLNAGFVLFALAIFSTLVLGRWFCGWGCHLVALQDLCTWLLKKAGLRPKPFRSRLLVWVPLVAAVYMFVWPTVARAWAGRPAPSLVAHFTTTEFWATFPGPGMTILTFVVCGGLIIYLLGNKGFCTYACPYGGFFGLADRVAPGRIRVTSACDNCGHCTAACTSNVRVHEEVRRHGMVVNPGCMKCTDCVSVCPKHALHFGFGRPAMIAAQARPSSGGAAASGKSDTVAPARRHDYGWPEELALAAGFGLALYAFRGLYDSVPFLLALGMASITAFVLVQAVRLVYVPSVSFHGLRLRLHGRITRGGRLFAAAGLGLALFVAHSAVVQYRVGEGERSLAAVRQAENTTVAASAVERSRAHFTWAARYGLFTTARTEARLGGLALFSGDLPNARRHLERALARAPHYGEARYRYAELVAREGDLPGAALELERALRDDPGLDDARQDLIAAARRLGRLGAVVSFLEELAQRRPHDPALALDIALVLGETGALDRAIISAQRVIDLYPANAEAWFRLGLLLAEAGKKPAALEACTRAVALEPAVHRRLALAQLALSEGLVDRAMHELEAARQAAPLDPSVLAAWADGLRRAGRVDAALNTAQLTPRRDLRTRYALAFLYRAAGDSAAANSVYASVHAEAPHLPPP
ncbi:MAG: tetratricopeptide repeat protein [Planctomycetota bacterium]